MFPTSNKGLARTVMTDQQQTDSIVSLLNQVKVIDKQTVWIGPDFVMVNGVLYLKKKLYIDTIYTKGRLSILLYDTLVVPSNSNPSDTLIGER